MNNKEEKILQLNEKLNALSKKQEAFSKEINSIRLALFELRNAELNSNDDFETEKAREKSLITTEKVDVVNEKDEIEEAPISEKSQTKVFETSADETNKPPKVTLTKIEETPTIKRDLEKFIGENLINKIGIAITVIGVAIGAKYSIENDLISPLTRIILGYLAGIGLLGFGIKLKKKYESYSAVLVSGAISVLYFITFSAYGFYGLFPQSIAFLLMFVFTAFAVVAAINYSRQVIAHIGLVGAYAIPFLLSEGSGKVAVLFTYMAIINTGVLVISFKKYWKPLFYSSFVLTWLIYFFWYNSKYNIDEHFSLALLFLAIFFILFYVTFLAYKVLKREQFKIDDVILLLLNSFVFFGLGYVILNEHEVGEDLLGLFALGNAIVHFIVSAIIFRKKLADKNIFYLVSGLVLVFISLAIPIQLDGNWVTLLWTGEAALLFWIGRTKKVKVYENLSYILMCIAFLSIIEDWTNNYNHYYVDYGIDNTSTELTPLFNINFLSSVLFVLAFGFIQYIQKKEKYLAELTTKMWYTRVFSFFIPAVLVLSIYYAFRLEIANYWNQIFANSRIQKIGEDTTYFDYVMNYDFLHFKSIWIINYSLLFLAILSFINIKKIKRERLGLFNLGLNTLAVVFFLTQGLYELSELRESYLEQNLSEYYEIGMFNLLIRYLSIGFFVLCILACYQYLRQEFMTWKLHIAFDLLLHISIVWILSSELIHWLDIAESSQSYKLGLSILWGVYALFIIGLGIWKKKKHLRISAISLFGITLIKLFFYDISHLDTISKTIVFVSLGILLLIISFLYNKYKQLIADEEDN